MARPSNPQVAFFAAEGVEVGVGHMAAQPILTSPLEIPPAMARNAACIELLRALLLPLLDSASQVQRWMVIVWGPSMYV